MTAPVDISLTVNGEPVEARVPPRTHLADFLREELGLTGTHIGCEHGVCGACTVRLDGEIVRGCLVLAVQAQGARVETIEGLSDTGEIADLQGVFQERNALQCGFCTPGMLIAAQDLLAARAGPEPRGDPRAPLGQLLPLHRLSGDRRRGRDRGEAARAEAKPMSDDDAARPLRARPAEQLHRPLGAAPEPRAPRAGAGAIRQRHGAAAHGRTSPSCARPMPMRASSSIDASAARTAPGVIAVVTGAELAKVCTPWVGVLSHLKGMKSAPQHAIALDRACWQGEAVAAVVARTRAAAEDAAEQVEVDYEELEPVDRHGDGARCRARPSSTRSSATTSPSSASSTPARSTRAFAEADAVVEATFDFGRHTGVTLEPRAIVAD